MLRFLRAGSINLSFSSEWVILYCFFVCLVNFFFSLKLGILNINMWKCWKSNSLSIPGFSVVNYWRLQASNCLVTFPDYFCTDCIWCRVWTPEFAHYFSCQLVTWQISLLEPGWWWQILLPHSWQLWAWLLLPLCPSLCLRAENRAQGTQVCQHGGPAAFSGLFWSSLALGPAPASGNELALLNICLSFCPEFFPKIVIKLTLLLPPDLCSFASSETTPLLQTSLSGQPSFLCLALHFMIALNTF